MSAFVTNNPLVYLYQRKSDCSSTCRYEMTGYLLLCLALAALGDAREMSLVLVKDALNEVPSYCCSSIYSTAHSLCRERCVWTDPRLVTTSGRAAAVEPTSGSCTRAEVGGASLNWNASAAA